MSVGTQALPAQGGAGTGNIVLDTATNDFTTNVELIGDDATIRDVNDLALGASTLTGDLLLRLWWYIS